MQNNNQTFYQPNLMVVSNQTDKTDKTDETNFSAFSAVSNTDFMKGIFGDIVDRERPLIVSFAGNPNTAHKSVWFASPWDKDAINLPSNHNNYVSIACFKLDAKGQYRRQKKQFSLLCAVMLDDVGTKVRWDKITIAPTWVIETSPGNYQIGYILNEPLADIQKIDQLEKSLINAGLTDPGASGFCTRLARLPVAINGKYEQLDGYWQCKLQNWQPQLRYSVEQICDGLKIKLVSIPKAHTKKVLRSRHNNLETITNDDHVITKIKAANLYKQSLGGGKHDISCPWSNEHTDQVDNGTAYFEPSEEYLLGGFKCLHGHCANRHLSEFFDFLGIESKPEIVIKPGNLVRICDEVEKELVKTGRYYQQGGNIVTISIDSKSQVASVNLVSLPELTLELADLLVWQRYDKRSEKLITCDPQEKSINLLLGQKEYKHLPVLNGVARHPYFTPDGRLVKESGYNIKTGLYGAFDAAKYAIPGAPTRHQAEQSLAELSALLSEFPFKNEYDKTAALSSILTAVVRPSLALAPMFHIKAPMISSGKSYLCELLTTFSSPRRGTPHAFPTDDTECKKLLLAELLMSPAVIEFDNLTSDITPHASLCTALTNEFISGRILGQSKTADVSTRALFLSSGNNVDPIGDMTRRVLTINLDPACETPATRSFNKQPVSEVRANREYFVSKALTIIQAWVCAGKLITACNSIASYGNWSNYCRQPLLWLGLPDPAINIFEAMYEDPEHDILGEFLQVAYLSFGSTSITVKEMVYNPYVDEDKIIRSLYEIMTDIAGERDGSINSRKLGHWLKRHSGRVIGNKRLVRDKSATRNTARWRIEVLE